MYKWFSTTDVVQHGEGRAVETSLTYFRVWSVSEMFQKGCFPTSYVPLHKDLVIHNIPSHQHVHTITDPDYLISFVLVNSV